jgi:hypothetical protein
MFSGLILRSQIHFELIVVEGNRHGPVGFLPSAVDIIEIVRIAVNRFWQSKKGAIF